MKRRESLSGQIVAANLLLVVAALFAASAASSLDLKLDDQRLQFALLAMTGILALLLNILMLQRRLNPLDELIREIEAIDPSKPASLKAPEDPVEEVERLAAAFARLLERIEAERRRAGRLQLRAQEEERKRVARDLHDEVNQALTALLLRLEAVRRQAPDPEVAAELAEIGSLISRAMSELLDLARGLRPTTLDDLGLKAALATLVEEVEREAGIAAGFEAEGELDGVPDDVQLVTYRVAQEAVTNVIQHADAGHLRVRLIGAADGAIELRVSDDGAGYAGGRSKERLGIAGMRERALLCGGELTVESEPGAGTRVTLQA